MICGLKKEIQCLPKVDVWGNKKTLILSQMIHVQLNYKLEHKWKRYFQQQNILKYWCNIDFTFIAKGKVRIYQFDSQVEDQN
jgi:hypothetical protein